MDDISSMINNVLNNPEAMKQISDIASQLGLGGSGGENEQNSPSAEERREPQKKSESEPSFDLGSIMMLKKAMETLNEKDENIELLRALKCHFSEKRAKKVDDAIKIMGLLRLLPLIKDSGLMSLFGGDK